MRSVLSLAMCGMLVGAFAMTGCGDDDTTGSGGAGGAGGGTSSSTTSSSSSSSGGGEGGAGGSDGGAAAGGAGGSDGGAGGEGARGGSERRGRRRRRRRRPRHRARSGGELLGLRPAGRAAHHRFHGDAVPVRLRSAGRPDRRYRHVPCEGSCRHRRWSCRRSCRTDRSTRTGLGGRPLGVDELQRPERVDRPHHRRRYLRCGDASASSTRTEVRRIGIKVDAGARGALGQPDHRLYRLHHRHEVG